jgi:hypothetical protein
MQKLYRDYPTLSTSRDRGFLVACSPWGKVYRHVFVDMLEWIHQFINDQTLSNWSYELAVSATPAISRALQACSSFPLFYFLSS